MVELRTGLFSISVLPGQARPETRREWAAGLSQLYIGQEHSSLAWYAGDLDGMEHMFLITSLRSISSIGEGCALYYLTRGADRTLGKVALELSE